MSSREELENMGFTFKKEEKLSYEELEKRYKAIKNYLFHKGISIPISVEPYSPEEKETRQHLPKLYWTERDYQAIQQEEEQE